MSLTVTGLLSPEFKSKMVASIVMLVSNGMHLPATIDNVQVRQDKGKAKHKIIVLIFTGS